MSLSSPASCGEETPRSPNCCLLYTSTPIGGGFASINVELRKRFELFANFRPIRNLPHIPTRYPGVDLIVVRENTEGLYSGIEHEVVPGVVESIKIITEKASTRISRFAFEYARKNKRKNCLLYTSRCV